MSMPEFPTPNPDMTREQSLNMLLSSIALEELALSHIINAEGEKIQYALRNPSEGECPASISEILSVNKSVTALLEMVMQNQILLKSKMEKILEHLPKPPCPPEPPCPSCPPCPPEPPCPPCPPCPPEPPCPPCPAQETPSCFQVIPGVYGTCHAVQWCRNCCDRYCAGGEGCEKIPLPGGGSFSANIALEFCGLEAGERIVVMKFSVHCLDRAPVCQLIYGTVSRCRPVLSQDVTFSVPCCSSPCYASLVVHSPDAVQLKQGYFSFKHS